MNCDLTSDLFELHVELMLKTRMGHGAAASLPCKILTYSLLSQTLHLFRFDQGSVQTESYSIVTTSCDPSRPNTLEILTANTTGTHRDVRPLVNIVSPGLLHKKENVATGVSSVSDKLALERRSRSAVSGDEDGRRLVDVDDDGVPTDVGGNVPDGSETTEHWKFPHVAFSPAGVVKVSESLAGRHTDRQAGR